MPLLVGEKLVWKPIKQNFGNVTQINIKANK
jgi:hypothetical protein